MILSANHICGGVKERTNMTTRLRACLLPPFQKGTKRNITHLGGPLKTAMGAWHDHRLENDSNNDFLNRKTYPQLFGVSLVIYYSGNWKHVALAFVYFLWGVCWLCFFV